MIRIRLGKLEKNREELMNFLRARLGDRVSLEDDVISIGDATPPAARNLRQIKTYVKRFLHKRGLKDRFRVLVAKGEMKVVELLQEKAEG